MALTKDYVGSIQFEIAKQKYYNAHKVDEKLDELKPQIFALIDENEQLKAALAAAGRENSELAEALKTASTPPAQVSAAAYEAEDITEKARIYAQKIVEDAQRKADDILKNAKRTAAKSSRSGDGLTPEQFEAVERINLQLEELQRSQATQIMRIRQAVITMATDA